MSNNTMEEEVKITEVHNADCSYNPQIANHNNMRVGKHALDLKCPRCLQLLDRLEQRREQQNDL